MMKPSAGVSYTTSASFNPLCGRAGPGSLPIFTSSAGRPRTARAGTPVNGHVIARGRTAWGFGFGFTGGVAACGAGAAAAGFFEPDPKAKAATATPTATATTAVLINQRGLARSSATSPFTLCSTAPPETLALAR